MERNYPIAIVLVDDDESVNYINKIVIRHFGFDGDVIPFDDSELAFDFLTGITSDFLPKLDPNARYLVFLDLNMPNFNGWHFLNRYLTLHECKRKHFKFVVLTNSADPQDKMKALQYTDVIGFARKPLTINMFKDIMEMFAVGKRIG